MLLPHTRGGTAAVKGGLSRVKSLEVTGGQAVSAMVCGTLCAQRSVTPASPASRNLRSRVAC